MLKAKRAEGYGRTDWVVMGPCDCNPEEEDCVRCDNTLRVCIKEGLTREQAEYLVATQATPFNPWIAIPQDVITDDEIKQLEHHIKSYQAVAGYSCSIIRRLIDMHRSNK